MSENPTMTSTDTETGLDRLSRSSVDAAINRLALTIARQLVDDEVDPVALATLESDDGLVTDEGFVVWVHNEDDLLDAQIAVWAGNDHDPEMERLVNLDLCDFDPWNEVAR